MTVTRSITTAEQLLAAGDIGRCELVRGELTMMSPAGGNHGRVASRLDARVRVHVEQNRLGEVMGAETGFLLARHPDTVRAPDLSFLREERRELAYDPGFVKGFPDLAVEVLSPGDTASEVMAKVQEWLDAGTEEVWVADPERKTIALYRKDQPVRVLGEKDELTSESLLPGFRVAVAEVFW